MNGPTEYDSPKSAKYLAFNPGRGHEPLDSVLKLDDEGYLSVEQLVRNGERFGKNQSPPNRSIQSRRLGTPPPIFTH